MKTKLSPQHVSRTQSIQVHNIPNMPTRNPWLTDSVYPISHDNPAATNSVSPKGPTKGCHLSLSDVKSVYTVFTCNPTVKKEGDQTILFAAGLDGIRKINATGESFHLVSFLPYPELESLATKSTFDAIQALLDKVNAARLAKNDAMLLALSKEANELGFNRTYLPNGAYNFIDRDGFHYAAFGGLKIAKTTDDNNPSNPLRFAKVADLSTSLPPELAKSQIVGLGMTYDGDIAVAAYGAIVLLDRDLNNKGTLLLPGEAVENSICIDEQGIYIVTSKRMLKVVWTGSKLSYNETDGGWESGYNTMTSEQAIGAGALTTSGGSGTTPALMGFGDDPDKLVIISDADPKGANVVAFWRDKIPDGFKQKPGTKSARIADQIRTDISKVTIEPSPTVLGTGVVVLNNSYPEPVPDIWSNAVTAGITRPAPKGVQKFNWNPQTKSFEKAWLNTEIDNTDVMVPVLSAESNMIYLANKQNSRYEYVGLDWDTGEIKSIWLFPDDSFQWNAYGGITTILENGDLMIGGLLAIKRVCIGEGK